MQAARGSPSGCADGVLPALPAVRRQEGRDPGGARPRWVAAAVLLIVAALATGSCAAPPPPAASAPLRIALHASPPTLDPHLQDERVSLSVLSHLYDTLVTFDAAMKIAPALAERWENPDDLTWRFFLRPGVRFHDGRELTIEDVVASLERARSHPHTQVSGFLVAVDEIRRVDASTLDLVTGRPYPILLNKLTFVAIVPADAPARIVDPVGTGPYRMSGALPAGIALAAFPGHWAGPAAIDRVEILFLADRAERRRRLLDGTVDVVSELESEDLARVERAPGVRVSSEPGLSVSYLQLRTDRAPLSDPRVREAIDRALDRQALVGGGLAGRGKAAGQLVPSQVFGHDPELLPQPRDLERARHLLGEAGYADGLELTLEHRQGLRLEGLRDQLEEAGFRVRLAPQPWDELYRRLQRSEPRFYYGIWACVSGDASDLFDQKAHSADPQRGYGGSNSNGYSNPELDRVIERAGGLLSMVQRRDLLARGMRILLEDRSLIPVAVASQLYGVRQEVIWEPRVDGRILAAEMRRVPP